MFIVSCGHGKLENAETGKAHVVNNAGNGYSTCYAPQDGYESGHPIVFSHQFDVISIYRSGNFLRKSEYNVQYEELALLYTLLA